MSNVVETWKPVSGYLNLYEVSDLGRVKSLKRHTTSGKILKQYVNPYNGYSTVSLSRDNAKKTLRVHVLVMNAFNPICKKPGYDKNHTINHIDGDKTNNALSNLEWLSQRDNQIHAVKLGLQSVIGVEVIDLDTHTIFNSFTDASRSVNGSNGEMVRRVCDGEKSHYKGHHFARLSDYLNGTVPEFSGKFKKRCSESLWR